MFDIKQMSTRARHNTYNVATNPKGIMYLMRIIHLEFQHVYIHTLSSLMVTLTENLIVTLLVISTSQIPQSLHLTNFATIFQALFNSVPIDKITETISFVSSHNKQNITS